MDVWQHDRTGIEVNQVHSDALSNQGGELGDSGRTHFCATVVEVVKLRTPEGEHKVRIVERRDFLL